MATITIEPVDATLAAVVSDVSLADLDCAGDAATWRAISEAFAEHAVLVFPGQHLDGDEQKTFAARFGPLELISGDDPLTPITNRRRDGSLREAGDPVMEILRGNEGWHTDSSYMPIAAKASMLSARVVPSAGGTTQWADMRAAYDALDEETKSRIDGLSVFHSIAYSQAKIGHTTATKGFYGFFDGPAPRRPLVKVHPETGRRALFIGRHAYGIPGLAEDESERLLAELLEFACRPPRVYEHHWEVGDLVVWDNRCVLHRARPWDLSEPRVMYHTRITGDPVSEGAL